MGICCTLCMQMKKAKETTITAEAAISSGQQSQHFQSVEDRDSVISGLDSNTKSKDIILATQSLNSKEKNVKTKKLKPNKISKD